MTEFYLIGILLVVLAAFGWFAIRHGRQSAQKDVAEADLSIKEKQVEAAMDRPDKPGLVERLRRGKF